MEVMSGSRMVVILAGGHESRENSVAFAGRGKSEEAGCYRKERDVGKPAGVGPQMVPSASGGFRNSVIAPRSRRRRPGWFLRVGRLHRIAC